MEPSDWTGADPLGGLPVMDHPSAWLPHKFAVMLAGLGNVAAWAQSAVTNNINTGAIVTFCTVAIPTMGAAVIYFTRTVWPVIRDAIFDYKERRAKLEALTLAGQMDRLAASLAEERRGREATAQLAEVQAKRADVLTSLVKDLNAKVDEANAGIAQANQRTEDANNKLHRMSGDSQAIITQAELGKLELQKQLDDAQAELRHANQQLGQLNTKVDQEIAGTSQLAVRNSVRLDELEKSSGEPTQESGSTDDYLPAQPR